MKGHGNAIERTLGPEEGWSAMRSGASRVAGVVAGLALALVAAIAVVVAPVAWGAGDVNEAACPNEALVGFTVSLPDCRAYEMVTPPFKDGASSLGVTAVSSDGSRVIAGSFSGFAGTEGDPFNGVRGAEYEFARSGSGSGWVASSITPPASLSPAGVLFGVSADGTRALWMVRGPSGSIESLALDVREADGSFVEVGPLLPPAAQAGPPGGVHGGESNDIHFAGASKDLSRVLFSIESLLWPGDTTTPKVERKSLYEYVGVGNARPTLVGVNSEDHLISNCETMAGAAYIEGGPDTYNAISASGETVFFTAVGHNASGCAESTVAPEVSELYARLDEVQTVAISEPSPGQCGRCDVPVSVAEGRRPAVFQGASEDGSKVFFLTEQELFAGDSTKNLYEYDFDAPVGEPPVGEHVVRVSTGSVAPEVQGVARVSEDGSHVYFVAKGESDWCERGRQLAYRD